ncbi:MAG: tetratricopeptide repeat protein [Pseudomonadota bacterium]
MKASDQNFFIDSFNRLADLVLGLDSSFALSAFALLALVLALALFVFFLRKQAITALHYVGWAVLLIIVGAIYLGQPDRSPPVAPGTQSLEAILQASRIELVRKDQALKEALAAVGELTQKAQEQQASIRIEKAFVAINAGNTLEAEAIFEEDVIQMERQARQAAAQQREFLAEAARAARHKGALARFRNTQDALADYRKATELEPDNPINWLYYGDLLLQSGQSNQAQKAYQEGWQQAQQVMVLNRKDPDLQRILSAFDDRIGDILQAQGDLDGALARYQQGLSIAEALSARDPANTDWQRDVSVSYDRIADILKAQGDLDGALARYQQGLGIRQALSARDPTNVLWRLDLVVSYVRMATIVPQDETRWLSQALAILRDLKQSGRLPPDREPWLKIIEGRLQVE